MNKYNHGQRKRFEREFPFGRTVYVNHTGVVVKVPYYSYPNCKDYNKNKKVVDNPTYKYILLSHKVWLDNGHPPVPKGYVLWHLDGDDKNNNIDNLWCVPRCVIGTMSMSKYTHRQSKNKEVTKSNLLLTWLEQTIKQKR